MANRHISGNHSLANLEYNAKVYEKYLKYLSLENPGRILTIGFLSFPELFEVLLPRLPQEFKDFVVCDASLEIVEFAKRSQKDERVSFIHLDIEENDGVTTKLRGTFDHLLSSYTLGALSDLKQALSNSYELLKSNGDLLFLFAKYDPAFSTYQNMSKNPRWRPFLNKYEDYSSTVEKEIGTKEKIIVWFEKLRFKIVVIAIDENVSCQYSKKDLLEIADFLDVVRGYIPINDLDDYIREYRQQFLSTEAVSQHSENNEDTSKMWKLKLPTITVVARK